MRDRLAPYLGQRIKIRGVFSDVLRRSDGGWKALVQKVCIGNERVTKHVWVYLAYPIDRYDRKLKKSVVQFCGVVNRYKRANGTEDYGIVSGKINTRRLE